MSWTEWKGKSVKRDAARAVARGVLKAAEVIGEESDRQVPHDEGFLQDSKTIEADPQNPMHVQIGYGGGGSSGKDRIPYAVRHHEVPANFQKGRKHNFLRDPVKTVGPKALRKALEQELGELL